MPLERPPSVEDQPSIRVRHWRVMELPNGDRHIVGVIIGSGLKGRVSSKITSQEDGVLVTRSSRQYTLSGSTGSDGDATYVWQRWCEMNDIDPTSAKNVSHEYEGRDA